MHNIPAHPHIYMYTHIYISIYLHISTHTYIQICKSTHADVQIYQNEIIICMISESMYYDSQVE